MRLSSSLFVFVVQFLALAGRPEASLADTEAMPGAWRLPDGAFVPAKMPMTLVHPRDHEAAPWAYAKNAHPGIRWEIPIVVQGGAWPFRYEIVKSGGAAGLAIGGELRRSRDGDHIRHELTETYGVLWWNEPIEGRYAIELRVTDQEGMTLPVPITLTVGREGWVFIDSANGDDENDGSHVAPFRSVARLHRDGDETYAQHRVYIKGLVRMDGNRPNGNLRMEPSSLAPKVWVGYPGSDAVLEAYEGRMILAAPDFYMANLEHRHAEDYFQDEARHIHMFTVWGNTDRFTLHDVTFSRFQGRPRNEGLGNSSIMMFTRADERRRHVAVVNCTLTGPSGILTSTYQLQHAVFEKNRARNAVFRLADGSVWGVIYIKGGNNDFITLRANDFRENTWAFGYGAIGLFATRNIEICYNTIDTPWESGRRGALKLWVNSALRGYHWTDETPVWIYRNSLRRRISWEGEPLANMPDGTVIIERNAFEGRAWPESTRIAYHDNLDRADLFDDAMRLSDAVRVEHLGRVGAEIAAPAN